MIKRFLLVCGILAVAACTAVADNFAQVFTAPTGVDTIDWSQLGPAFNTVSSPASWTSNLGAPGTASDSGTLEQVDEGNGWTGTFNLNDHLLWNQDNGNAIDIHFSSPISLGGAQIQNDFSGNFTGYIQAIGSFGTSQKFQISGNNTQAEDGSAPFIGIQDLSGGNITDLLFTTDSAVNGGTNFTAIDTVLLGSAVPEPGSFAVVGLLFLILAATFRKQMRAKAGQER